MSLRIHSGVREETRAAALWYDDRERGLGSRFLGAVNRGMSSIADDPRIGSTLETLPDEPNVMRLLLRPFPYMIVYEIAEGVVRVIAVAHTARMPNYWLHRLDDDDNGSYETP